MKSTKFPVLNLCTIAICRLIHMFFGGFWSILEFSRTCAILTIRGYFSPIVNLIVNPTLTRQVKKSLYELNRSADTKARNS